MGCWLIFPVFFAIWQWLKIQNTKYRITTESVLVESGIFIRDINELKLSRIVDIRYHDTTMGRLFGASMIV